MSFDSSQFDQGQVLDIDGYERGNLEQPGAESDHFSLERYQQFARHAIGSPINVLDVGCATGRGGAEFARLRPEAVLWGLDVVQDRLDTLPDVYERRMRGLSTNLPIDDQALDLVLAGEFLEHLRPHDVDTTICEFQRVLRIGGQLLLTTPNPDYVRLLWARSSVYGPGHLTQHHIRVLRLRLRMHGFSHVRVHGSGGVVRYLGEHVPVRRLYGSYLVSARKW
jgi:SAM-dependent methyltransferase